MGREGRGVFFARCQPFLQLRCRARQSHLICGPGQSVQVLLPSVTLQTYQRVSPLSISLFAPHSLDTPFFCALFSLFLVFYLLHFANNFHVDKMRRQHPKKKRRNEMRLNNLCRAAKRNSGILNQEEGCKENKVNNSIRSYNEMTLTASSFCFSLNNC